MATKRFMNDGGLNDTMQVARNVIQEAKNAAHDDKKEASAAKPASQDTEQAPRQARKGRRPLADNKERTSLHNVTLDEKTLWRLEYIKKKLNKQRAEGDPFVSIDGLIYKACVEWLDKVYPETEETYQIALQMGLLG